VFYKISIVFHPLGLNHFISRPLSEIGENHYAEVMPFKHDITPVLEKIKGCDNNQSLVNLLDEFFISSMIGFKNKVFIDIVDKMLRDEEVPQIQELAAIHSISRKSILRWFKLYLDMTPSEYRSIIKFRKAIDTQQSDPAQARLSHMAYDGNYYDQADFNNHFKDKTGFTPTQLFSEIRDIQKGLMWKMSHEPEVEDQA